MAQKYAGGRANKNAYKVGKLTKNAKFSRKKKLNPTPIIILLALFLSFIFAMILGNHLSKKVEQSQNAQDTPPTTSVVLPDVDKVNPTLKLRAYLVDLHGAGSKPTLSELTEVARGSGNALFVEMIDSDGKLIYTSDVSSSISQPSYEDFTLARLKNHFEYYNDYALGFFKSSFSANLSVDKRLKIQANEISLLSEAASEVFNQIIVQFDNSLTKSSVLHYQSYLLNLKLAASDTPIGVLLPLSVIENVSNHSLLAEIMKVADFFVIDCKDMSAEQIDSSLASLVYFSERYNAVAILNQGEDADALALKISTLERRNVYNYIIK
jgi:hypothetical protein